VVKVRKTEGKRLRANTKEIEKRVNVWKLSEEAGVASEESRVSAKDAERLMEQLRVWIAEDDSPFCIFNDYVDFEIYPFYRELVEVGVCMQTILARLQNHYYTGYLSLQQDIRMVQQNSLKFNGPNHPVSDSAAQFTTLLLELLASDNAPLFTHTHTHAQ
jgi:hypothetical protein